VSENRLPEKIGIALHEYVADLFEEAEWKADAHGSEEALEAAESARCSFERLCDAVNEAIRGKKRDKRAP
jgi:hypothetical protein